LVLTYDFFRFVSLPLNLYEDPPPQFQCLFLQRLSLAVL
jgi:hypothetical protein